jgi:hypothetical protein
MLEDDAKRAVEQMQFPHESANREDCQSHLERLMHKFGAGRERTAVRSASSSRPAVPIYRQGVRVRRLAVTSRSR